MKSGRRAAWVVLALVAFIGVPASPAAAVMSAPRAGSATPIPEPTRLTVFTSGTTVGGTICLDADLTADGYPLRERTVVFALLGAPVGSAVTGLFGRAQVCVPTALHGGTYPGGIGAGFAGDSLFAPSAGSADFTIFPFQTQIETFSASGPYLGTATLQTRLYFRLFGGYTGGWCGWPKPLPCVASIEVPLVGRTIFFFRLGLLVGSAVTDANGIATLPDVPLSGLNSAYYEQGVTAVFAGEADYTGATVNTGLFVEPQVTSLVVTPVSGPSGGSTSLSAQLRFGDGMPLADRLIVFYVNDTIVGTATTGGTGVAKLEDVSLANVAPGTYAAGVKALFLGELNFYPTAGSAALVVGS